MRPATAWPVTVFEAVMPSLEFAIAQTPRGAFAAAWGPNGVVRTWFHERTAEGARAQVRRSFPTAVERPAPADLAAAMVDIAVLLTGEARRIGAVELDMAGVPAFDRRVYEVVRDVPPGETITYGEIANVLGEEPMRARDVGQAMARNPFAPIVPCHRVVAANGRLGGYSAPGGESTKRRLLEIEGAAIVAPPAVSQPGLFDGFIDS